MRENIEVRRDVFGNIVDAILSRIGYRAVQVKNRPE